MGIVVVCTRPPGELLGKRRTGKTWSGRTKTGEILGMKLSLGPPTPDDPVPPELAGKIISVLRTSGPITKLTTADNSRNFFRWLDEIATAAEGAVMVDGVATFISYIALVRGRFEALVAARDFAALAAWIERAVATPALTAEAWALNQLARPVAIQGGRDRDLAVAPILVRFTRDREVPELILALAREPGAEHLTALQESANDILDQRQQVLDYQAPAPTTIAELRAIYDHRNPRTATRLRQRFADQNTRLLVELIASGYCPAPHLEDQLVEDLRIPSLRDEALLARLASDELAHAGPVGRRVQALAIAHRETYAAQSSTITDARLAEYERYRNDPLVLKPRARGMDMALHRPLVDGLYGEARARPMLPEPIVLMVCDRRFDDAYAAYLDQFRCEADQAEAAIRDAITYFAYGGAFTRPH